MATRYRIHVGKEEIEFEGPDNLSDTQITTLGDKFLRTAKPGQSFPHSVYAGVVPAPANEPTPDQSSVGGAATRGALHGGYFNWDDELAAAGNAAVPGMAWLENKLMGNKGKGLTDLVTGQEGSAQEGPFSGHGGFWDRYKHNMDAYQTQDQADAALHPTARALGEIGGSLATIGTGQGVAARVAPKAVLALKALAKGKPIRTAMAIGAPVGAISGAGAGRGNRGQSAALGLITGAGLSAGVTGGIELAPRVAHYGQILFNKMPVKAALAQMVKSLDRDGFDVASATGITRLKAAIESFTGKPVSLADLGSAVRARAGVALRSPSKAQQAGIDTLTARQAGAVPRLEGDIKANVAPRTDVHALNEDLIKQRAAQAVDLKKKALFEQGRAPLGQLETTKVVDNPESGQVHNITHTMPDGTKVEGTLAFHPDLPDAELTLHPPGGDGAPWNEGQGRLGVAGVRDLYSQLKQKFPNIENIVGDRVSGARAQAGTPGALQVPVKDLPPIVPGGKQARIINDPELDKLLALPATQKAMSAAVGQADMERSILEAQGMDVAHLPDVKIAAQLKQMGIKGQGGMDMRTLDYLKRFLDDQVNMLYKHGKTETFSAGMAGQVKALRNAIRDRLKTANPAYDDYLKSYGGSSDLINALGEGQDFTKYAPEEIAKAQAGHSEAGQEFYRTGVARNLLDRVRSAKFGASAAQRIVQSPEEIAQLEAAGINPSGLHQAVGQERQLNLLNQELQGSATAQRQAAQADADESMHLPVPFNPLSARGWGGAALRGVINHVSPSRNAAVNEQMIPRMLESNPKAIEGIINELVATGRMQEAEALKRAVRVRTISAVGGNIIGGPVALPQENYNGR